MSTRPKKKATGNIPYQASPELHKALFEQAADGIFIADNEGRYIEVNQHGCEMLGYTRQELLALSMKDLILAYEPLQLAQLRTGSPVLRERYLRCKDGRLLPVEVNAQMLADGSFLGIVRDISKRKQVEEELRDSNERFRLLAESSLTGIYLIQENVFRYVNPAMAHIFGYEVEEVIDKLGPMDMVHPDDRSLVAANIQRRTEGKIDAVRYDFRGLRKDGSTRHIEVYGRRIEYNGKTGVIGTLMDITDRKQSEEALRNSEAQLQLALEAAQMGLWNWEITTGEMTWSQKCLALYGLAPDTQMSYERFLHILHPEDRARIDAALNRAVAEHVRYDEQKRVIWPDGSMHWTASRGQVYDDERGQPIRMLGVTFDITRWKEAEDELRHNREAALQFSTQLTVLQEITIQLSKAESSDDLCRQAVQMARSRLGFSRVSIWFIEEQLGLMRGSFGVDEQGQLRDERNARVKFRRRGAAWRIFSHKQSIAIIEHGSLYNHLGEVVGQGDNAMAALWDGDEVIGVISVDNLLAPHPITERQLEILRLYAITLGHLITRKRAQEALTLFRTLVDRINDAIEVIEPETGRFLDVNEQACHALGYTREEFLNLTVPAINPLVAERSWQESLEEIEQAGALVRESKHQRKDGSVFPVEININYIHLDRDYILAVVRNITERKRAEKALRASEEQYRALYRDNPSMFFTLNSDGVIISVNAFGANQLGYTIDELIGQPVFMVIYEEDRTAVTTQLQHCLQRPGQISQWQFRKVRKDGVLVWVEEFARAVTHPNGEIDVLVVCQDITDRKQAELEQKRLLTHIKEQAQQVQNIINTVPEGVILLSAQQEVTLTNPVARQYLALLAPGLANGRLTHLGQRAVKELLTSPPKGLWHEITSSNLVFEAITRPVEAGPHNGGWVLVLRDVTQEREIQRRVQRQERLAAVGQLAAGIAHDFNNILAVITLYTQLISRTVEMPARIQDRLQTIEQQIKRAKDLIQQILDFGRQSVLERQPVDLLPFMEKLVHLLERALPEHIQITLQHDAEAYFIQADPSRIQQVIMNLAVNARDAMPQGGHLTITLAHVQTRETQSMPVQDLPPGDWIQVAVSDSGDGIPKEVLSHIFEPFFTTKAVGEGTGLGLAQVYGIVQQHEGTIDVTTKPGQGTTFSLYFPALTIGANPTDMPETGVLHLGHGQRILLVEDDRATRGALLDSLEHLNYRIVTAANGRIALTILSARASEFDLVLSDVVMPEMGGIALFHAMREQHLTVPVVLLTGHPLSNEMEDLQALGLAGWLPKPPDLIALSRLLGDVLSG